MSKRFVAISFAILLCMMFLQGCSTEGETSIKVLVNEKGTQIEATLKSDESKNYEWLYFTKNNKLTESATKFSKDIFSNTYTQKYGFVIDERGSDVVYFVLYQTDDIESGKIFEYEIYYNDDGTIVLGEQKESSLKNNNDLLEQVKAAQ